MIYFKISTLCLSLLIFAGWAWLGEVSGSSGPLNSEIKTKVPGVSPVVREKAFGLLESVLVDTGGLKSRQEAVEIKFRLTDLLWEKDRSKAESLFASLATEADKEGCFCNVVAIETLAARDAKLAIKLFESSRSGLSEYQREEIYDYFAAQYPEEALREGKEAVKSNRYAHYLDSVSMYGSNAAKPANGSYGRLGKLYSANKRNGADLARDIVRKLPESRLSIPQPYVPVRRLPANQIPFGNLPANFPYANAPIANAPPKYPSNSRVSGNLPMLGNDFEANAGPIDNRIPFSAAADLLSTAISSLNESAKNGEQAILNEAEIKGLAVLIAKAVIAAKKIELSALRPIYSQLKKYAPIEMARFDRTLSARQRRQLTQTYSETFLPFPPSGQLPQTEYIPPRVGETIEEKLEREFVNEMRQVEERHLRDQSADAIEFIRLKQPEKYPDLMVYFREVLPEAYARTGNIAELRPLLADETNRTRRLELLSFAAIALADRGDKTGAVRLIDEAGATVVDTPKKKEEFLAAEAHTHALAQIDPVKGFIQAEKLLDHANRLLTISKELRDFVNADGSGSSLESRRRQMATNSFYAISVIRVLAHADFERTVKLADRFSEPDQRVFFRWFIVNALLNKNAESEEKELKEWDNH